MRNKDNNHSYTIASVSTFGLELLILLLCCLSRLVIAESTII